jgi:hypothetical protein
MLGYEKKVKRHSCVLTALFVLLFSHGALAQDASHRADRQAIEAKIDAVLRTDHPSRALKSYYRLFVAAGADGLPELEQSPYDSVAIQAAWREIVLTIPKGIDDKGTEFRPDPAKVNWFLGFLAGRGRIRIPKWWSQAVLDARAHQSHDFCFEHRDPHQPPSNWTNETVVTTKGNNFSLRVGNDSTEVPKVLLEEYLVDGKLRPAIHCSACLTSKNCYLAICHDDAYAFRLACFDRTTAKVVWTARACGSFSDSISGPVDPARVAVDVQDDRVVVFSWSTGVDAEAYRADNGKNLFRFSSAFSARY